ncbi:tetratricopeptide repeat protein [Cellulophaga sp. 20_2_10]|uniref:tetratricopeptide repeat protein n=1 Tax=Cellulophaga sp. 20_2_10 TaxID=2942476 RepID=UPI00201B2B80|nr:tetratricopeptide repeat protein [Cellulophaga sp. 20_2_10]MCL5245652.1 tetratricopeptide repeat protein [Cellulophaga sp. 20_2_10]
MKMNNLLKASVFVFLLTCCTPSNESKADTYKKNGDTEKAIAHYKLAIEEGSVKSMNKLALLYVNNHKLDEAKKYYQMSFEKGNESAAQILASLCASNNDYQGTITYGKKLADSGNLAVIYNLGDAYLNLGKYDEAIKYLTKDSTSVFTKNLLGEAYYQKGDLKNAEKVWKSAVGKNHIASKGSLQKLLRLYLKQGRTDEYKEYKNIFLTPS